jgi:uncharacterized protein involved in response to NO
LKNYWQLIDAGEPYRLLFPLGTLFGIIGVMLWPAHVWFGLAWPTEPHAGIMLQGFLAAFVIGFLGTALPRLLEVPRMRLAEAALYAALLVVVSGLHLLGFTEAAHAVFLLLMLTFLGSLLQRARQRKDIPPPGFVLVAMGMLCALFGSALLLLDGGLSNGLTVEWYLFARRLLHQGFLLLPIMGVGAFLLPRFFNLPSTQLFPESFKPPPGWWRKAAFAAACGAAVCLSFVFEVVGWSRTAFLLRAFAIIVYALVEIPVHQARFSGGTLALSLRIALLSLPIGYILMAILPQWQMALIHVVFITGFSLLTFTVATRVVLGHSGREHLFNRRLLSILFMLSLFLLAMLTRVTADWMPDIRMSHYAYASICWAVAAIVWLWKMGPGLRLLDGDS